MRRSQQEIAWMGAGYGIAAGVFFALAEIALSAAMGASPFLPLRMFASVLLGVQALTNVSLGIALVAGISVHLVLSGFYGALYGLLNTTLQPEVQKGYGPQVAMGVVFGIGLWLINFQIIARLIYPWYLELPQGIQASLHAVTYGAPLGALFARAALRDRLPA